MFKRQRSAHSDGAGMTLVEHLAELRRRIIISVLALALGVVVGFYYSSPMVQFLLRLPGELVYLYPGEAFFVHLEVALVVGSSSVHRLSSTRWSALSHPGFWPKRSASSRWACPRLC